ncbi:MAG: PEP-CTERM sorting domain-containing protein [Proteobacteria bacterium]|nr:PEP-CTERM sorting domain-containing protein [Pseudomonadota bacterium]
MTAFHTSSLAGLGAAAMLATAGLAPGSAQAAWMGLADGDYSVVLHCDSSTQIACPSDLSGSLSIAGGQATAFDIVVDGVAFNGDPVDAVVDGTLVDTEASTLSFLPYTFLSLRLITDGQIGSYGVGDRWWVYCNNIDPTTCTPNTTGTWSVDRLASVPEPAPAALLALALTVGCLVRRRSRQV